MKPVVNICKDLDGVRHFWCITVQDWVRGNQQQCYPPTKYTRRDAEAILEHWTERFSHHPQRGPHLRGAYILVDDSAPVEQTEQAILVHAIKKNIEDMRVQVARLEAIADLARELAHGRPVHTEDCKTVTLSEMGRVEHAARDYQGTDTSGWKESNCDCKAGETYRTLKTLCG